MLDLPDDLGRLRILERLAEIILRDIRIKITEAEKRERAMRPVRELRNARWVLSHLRQGGHPVEDSVHLSDCTMAAEHTRPLTREQAVELLTGHTERACPICRPDTDLGILE
ncbi:DUF6233 domain-containing protein [Streptomyces sp. NPDC006339]|uniref:DUF6233 domain-containing protein n=1 Tax=Streptomyces sp. NPDC006339 TaxID=3156755 RepID=UPI0033A82FF4